MFVQKLGELDLHLPRDETIPAILHRFTCRAADRLALNYDFGDHPTFNEILDYVRAVAWPADLVLATGDLVHDASPEGYQGMRERFASLGIPTYCIPGNHDDPRQMANQLAANFSFHDDQVERIADHLTRFWAPSMRRLIVDYIEQGGEGLESAVCEAARKLKVQ